MASIKRMSLLGLPLCLGLFAAESKTWNFESDAPGKLPAGWTAGKTREGAGSEWRIVEDATVANGKRALAQVSSAGDSPQFNLCVLDDPKVADLDLSVKLKPRTGKLDQGGGLVWRYQDTQNYYIARWNPLEDNLRVYKVVKGKRSQMDTAKVKADPQGWHFLRVVHVGRSIRCYLDGKLLLEAADDEFPNPGQIGLWTKADAVTHFDELMLRAADAKDIEEL